MLASLTCNIKEILEGSGSLVFPFFLQPIKVGRHMGRRVKRSSLLSTAKFFLEKFIYKAEMF